MISTKGHADHEVAYTIHGMDMDGAFDDRVTYGDVRSSRKMKGAALLVILGLGAAVVQSVRDDLTQQKRNDNTMAQTGATAVETMRDLQQLRTVYLASKPTEQAKIDRELGAEAQKFCTQFQTYAHPSEYEFKWGHLSEDPACAGISANTPAVTPDAAARLTTVAMQRAEDGRAQNDSKSLVDPDRQAMSDWSRGIREIMVRREITAGQNGLGS